MSLNETRIDIPAEHVSNIFGQFDHNIKLIERTLNVTVVPRNEGIKVIGDTANVEGACKVFAELLQLAERGNMIDEQKVAYTLSLLGEHKEGSLVEIDKDCICHTINGKPVKPKTLGQKAYLAMAMAITAFKNEEVNRIILTRPAIEAGEKLGFLPGDLQSKVDPYLRPLYDALYQIMGAESFQRNMEKGLIEVAPLAYMRGRTLDNAFIILDEAQNTTPAQMKMFLTRIGFGSKVVVTGDATQKDLAPGTKSGLDVALRVLRNVDEISVCKLTSADVVRHPLVQKIVKAYDDYESKANKRTKRVTKNEGR